MQQTKLEFAILQYKSYQTSSGVALTLKAARKPGRATRKLTSIASQTAGGGVIVEEFADGAVHFRCPPGTRRAGKWTDRMGTDCNFGGSRVALNRIGEGIQNLDRALEQRENRMRAGGPGTVRYSMGRAALSAADALDRMAERRESRRRDRKPGKVRQFLGEQALQAADRLDRRKLRKDRERQNLRDSDVAPQAVDIAASRLHDAWRAGRLKEDGTYEPRMKDDGKGGEVDIANTDYADLPEKWKKENRDSARSAIQAIVDNPNADDEEIADLVHQAWMERNGDWAPAEQMVPYADLPEAEKQKDRDVVKAARESLDTARDNEIQRRERARAARQTATRDDGSADVRLPTRISVEQEELLEAQPTGRRRQPTGGLRMPSPGDVSESIAVEGGARKRPGRQYGGAFKNEQNAEKRIAELSAQFPDQDFHLVKDENGKFRIVDDDRLPSYEEGAVSSFRNGQKVGSPTIPTPEQTAAAAEVKKPKKLSGRQYGGAFKNRENAEKRAKKLSEEGDGEFHVVEDENGKFRIVDGDRLDSLGSEPVATFAAGNDLNETPGDAPDPNIVGTDSPDIQEVDGPSKPDWAKEAWESYMNELESQYESGEKEKPEPSGSPQQAITKAADELAKAQKMIADGDVEGGKEVAGNALAQLEVDMDPDSGLFSLNNAEMQGEAMAALMDEAMYYREALAAATKGVDMDGDPQVNEMLDSLRALTLKSVGGDPNITLSYYQNAYLRERRTAIDELKRLELNDDQKSVVDELEADLVEAEQIFASAFGNNFDTVISELIDTSFTKGIHSDQKTMNKLDVLDRATEILRSTMEDTDENDAFLANIERLLRRARIAAKRKSQGKQELYAPDPFSTEVDERTQRLVSKNIDAYEEMFPSWIESFRAAGSDAERADFLRAMEDQFLNIGHDMEVSDEDLPRYNEIAKALVAMATEGDTEWKPSGGPSVEEKIAGIAEVMDANPQYMQYNAMFFDADKPLGENVASITAAENALDDMIQNPEAFSAWLDSVGSDRDPDEIIDDLQINIDAAKAQALLDFQDSMSSYMDEFEEDVKKYLAATDPAEKAQAKEILDDKKASVEYLKQSVDKMIEEGADADDVFEAQERLDGVLEDIDSQISKALQADEKFDAPEGSEEIFAAVGETLEEGVIKKPKGFDYTGADSDDLADWPEFKTSKKLANKPDDMSDEQWEELRGNLASEMRTYEDVAEYELVEFLDNFIDDPEAATAQQLLDSGDIWEKAKEVISGLDAGGDYEAAARLRSNLHDYSLLVHQRMNEPGWDPEALYSKLSPRGQKYVDAGMSKYETDMQGLTGKAKKKKPKIELGPNESATDAAPLAQTQEGPIEFSGLPAGSVVMETFDFNEITDAVYKEKWTVDGDTPVKVVVQVPSPDLDGKYYVLDKGAWDSMSEEDREAFNFQGLYGGKKSITDDAEMGLPNFMTDRIFSGYASQEEAIAAAVYWAENDGLRSDVGARPTLLWDKENNELIALDGETLAQYLSDPSTTDEEMARFKERMEIVVPNGYYQQQWGGGKTDDEKKVDVLRDVLDGKKLELAPEEPVDDKKAKILSYIDPDANLAEALAINDKNKKIVQALTESNLALSDGDIDVNYQGAISRLQDALNMFREVVSEKGYDIDNLTDEQIKTIFWDPRFDSLSSDDPFDDGFIKWRNRLERLVVARDAYGSEMASRRMAEIDAVERLQEVEAQKLPVSDLDALVKNAVADADSVRSEFFEMRTSLADKAGDVSEAEIFAFQAKRTEMLEKKRFAEELTAYRDTVKSEKFGDDKVPVKINGVEHAVAKADVGNSYDSVEKATNLADMYSELNSDQYGVYKDDFGNFVVMKRSAGDAIGAEAISVSVDGSPDADTTLATKAPDAPPLKEGYAGTENLGINNENGEAIGKFVAVGENGMVDVETATSAVESGESLANVPNRFLKDSIWANTAGGGWSGDPAGARFELLSSAGGHNNIGKPPKDQTNRFLDRTTGQTFVIKTATRNDQEGVREIVGNHFMGLMGMRTSGGRTAGAPFNNPNKYGPSHPEWDPEAEQIPVLIESSEMLYDGTPLGHITKMDLGKQADIISRLTPESLASALVMDSHFRYYDRQNDNWIPIEMPDGSIHYHPIDHGNAFGPFKAHKFHDKNGQLGLKSQSTQEYEDELGFMFTGLDGKGAWRLAQESMTTPERRRAFAEAVVRQVRRSESVDYEAEALRVAEAQHLDGKSKARAVTIGKMMDEKKGRLDSYIDPMLKELGFSDEEIASIRKSVDDPSTPNTPSPTKKQIKSMVDPNPVDGEEVFGGRPSTQNSLTYTQAANEADATPGKVTFASLGGSDVVGGLRFRTFTTSDDPAAVKTQSVSMMMRPEVASRLADAIDSGTLLDGEVVESKTLDGHQVPQMVGGHLRMFTTGDTSLDSMFGFSGNGANLASGGSGPGVKTHVAKTSDGYVIVSYTGTSPNAYGMNGTVQIFKHGEPATPDEIASLLGKIGVEPRYTDTQDVKLMAGEMLVRTFDRGPKRFYDDIAERLLRVANEYGVTTSDVEVYYDSTGRMRLRLTEDAYREMAEKHGWNDVGAMVKTMSSKPDGENVTRLFISGGVLSKREQVLSGSGLNANAVAGGGGVGAGADDLANGGGLGTYLSVQMKDGGHTYSAWQFGSNSTTVVIDPEPLMREIGWWAYGPNDGPWGVLNPASYKMNQAVSPGDGVEPFDYVNALKTGKVFEFNPDGATSMDHVKMVIVGSKSQREKIIADLAAQGITEVNGRPVGDIIVTRASKAKMKANLPDDWTAKNIWGISLGSS